MGFTSTLLESRTELLDLQLSGFGLPASYLNFVQHYKIEQVSIGMLELVPPPSNSLREPIQQLNGDDKSPFVEDRFVHVSNFEGDLVLLIKGRDGHEDGRVFFGIYRREIFPYLYVLRVALKNFLLLQPILIKDRLLLTMWKFRSSLKLLG